MSQVRQRATWLTIHPRDTGRQSQELALLTARLSWRPETHLLIKSDTRRSFRRKTRAVKPTIFGIISFLCHFGRCDRCGLSISRIRMSGAIPVLRLVRPSWGHVARKGDQSAISTLCGCQVPSRIDGGVSFGQYMRSMGIISRLVAKAIYCLRQPICRVGRRYPGQSIQHCGNVP